MDILLSTIVFAAVWYARYRYDRPGAAIDLKLFSLLWIGMPRQDSLHSSHSWRWRSHFLLKGYCCLHCACCVGFFILDVYLVPWAYKKRQENKVEIQELESKVKRLQWEFDNGRYTSQYDYNDESSPLKPILFPCRTSHTRFFPKKHSFSYSYLFVGIPVGWRGWVSSLLTADLKSLPWKGRKPKSGWFNVDSADYLARGDSIHGLRGKLDTYLESQNEKVDDYPDAYLVTAPRFLRYSFNPVSFWYLYNRTKELKAMILEVNNTFDERRMYFLKATETESGASEDSNKLAAEEVDEDDSQEQNSLDQKVKGRFTKSWPKDFHVSPFNSRKGAYSLSANDPFFPHLSSRAGAAIVDNTITLNSSKQHPKLIARVFSSSDSIDPYKLEGWDTFKFIAAWWWVGLVTFPRIAREAAKLFFRRGLHVWYRPEVLKDSIGRNETQDEIAIAAIFIEYLKNLVERSDLTFSLNFLPGIATMSAEESFTPHALRDKPKMPQGSVAFKITSPLFYDQISRCPSVSKYVEVALSKPDAGTATFHTSHPELLAKIFKQPSSVIELFKMWPWWNVSLVEASRMLWETSFLPPPTSLLHRLRWLPIHLLRRLPSQSHNAALSDLDTCAVHLLTTDAPKARAYRKAVLKMLLSEYVALGSPAVIDIALWIARIWLCWLCVLSFDGLVGLCNGDARFTMAEVAKVVMGCLGVHLWWGLGEML